MRRIRWFAVEDHVDFPRFRSLPLRAIGLWSAHLQIRHAIAVHMPHSELESEEAEQAGTENCQIRIPRSMALHIS